MVNFRREQRRVFPVLRVAGVVGDLQEPRRAEGRRVPKRAAADKALAAARKLLRTYADENAASAARALRRLASLRKAPRRFLRAHDCLADVVFDRRGKASFRFDADAFGELDSHEGARVLWACALVHQAASAAGLDEREALLETSAFHDELTEADRESLAAVLSLDWLDANGVFERFLRMSAGQDRRERVRATAWLRARLRAALPYSSEGVLRAVAEETELQALRDRVYEAINDSYVPEVDDANAEAVADWCRENGVRLVGGRFSRALYIDAMLMAAAKVFPSETVRRPIAELGDVIGNSTFDLRTPQLKTQADALSAVGGEAQSLLNLVSKDTVSVAELAGAAGKLRAALRGVEGSLSAAIDEAAHEAAGRIAAEEADGKATTLRRLSRDRAEVAGTLDDVRAALSRVEAAAATAPKGDPVFVVFFQRLFPLDAINMGMMNELLDPFFGEDEEIHELLRESGHNLYTTPNLRAWLRKCDDWIEALPAYATYTIIPQEGGSYKVRAWVQRGILEDMYRRHAEDWAVNIDEVMALEHVALAREILVERLGLAASVHRRATRDGVAAEEAARLAVVQNGLESHVADLAALIEKTYLDLCVEVAKRREERELPRMEALRAVLNETAPPANLVAQALARSGKTPDGIGRALKRAVRRRGVTRRGRELLPLAGKRRRELPCAHVLTTLGPGETEMNIANWLEESMALFNVSRAHGLEGEVRERVASYERRLAAVGNRLVEELDLEGDLYAIMREDGLDTESDSDQRRGVLKLLSSYPEVASEAAKLALLLDHEAATGDATSEGDEVGEPRSVEDHIREHRELEAEAVSAVVSKNGLEPQVAALAREKAIDEDEAAEAIVLGDAATAAELESTRRSLARSRVIDALGLTDEVRGYVRTRLDNTLATVIARREVIAERGLSAALTDPRYRYDATGPFKKYNLLYTPSRVDLGAEEVRSVRNVPKWVGGLDADAANAGAALYSLYNLAGPTPVDSPRLAEFLKVGENFFSRGGVFYLSLAAGANIDALGMGDFEFFRDQWNLRGDRMVLPAGETYGGFCVPKEFSLLYAIITRAVSPETSDELMDGFGVPTEIREEVVQDLRRLLRMRLDCADGLEWEMKAAEALADRYQHYFGALGRPGYVARLPQLARTLQMAGALTVQGEREREMAFALADWVNKKAQGLEEINRIGPFRKVALVRRLVEEARRRNPRVAPDHKLVGVMTASYKEGERKDGKEIPITDVRFSAGARKLEVYAGTAEHHLLKDIDPEGRALIRRMFEGFIPPADIRMVGTCTGSDILNHVPGSGLEDVKEEVHAMLLDAGLDDALIDTNAVVYGGDLERWSGIRDLPDAERKALVEGVGPRIHLLVLDRRGVHRTYEQAVQGTDFLDLGIPDPELLDLIDDLPKLLYLMRRGRSNSALVFADGTSGGRRRAFSFRYANGKRKVKELFALDELAVYGALGVGQETVDAWRAEMQVERDDAAGLLDALVARDAVAAAEVYDRIRRRIMRERKAEEAVAEEIAARKAGVRNDGYRLRSAGLGKVRAGLPLATLDFGTWLVLGGEWVVNGKHSEAELAEKRSQFEAAVRAIPRAKGPVSGLSDSDVDALITAFVRPRYEPPTEFAWEEIDTGIAGSLKAAEEQAARLESREIRRRQARRAWALRERAKAFAAAEEDAVRALRRGDFDALYDQAKAALGDPRADVSQEAFGKFLQWSRVAFAALAKMTGQDESAAADVFAGGEVTVDAYRPLAEQTTKAAESARGDRDVLERVAMALELLDIALAVEQTTQAAPGPDMTLEIARFFDLTINNHIFDYVPYHYHAERGAAFEGLAREEKMALAARRHRWLYTHLRHLLATQSEFADRGTAYVDAWLGDADRDVAPIGVNVETPDERFWFSYARLRDASVLRHEGYPLPELFVNLDPSALKCEERANVVIVYPHGNTTVPVALEQGAKLAERDGINLMLCAWPKIVPRKDSLKTLELHDGFVYVSRDDYEAALRASGAPAGDARARAAGVGDEGVLVAATFSRPVTAHGIFFHFTHPLRPDIGSVRAPLIQPVIWEAATHLKCRLPDMLKGSGTRTAPQINWYEEEAARLGEASAKAKIERDLVRFSRKHETIIVKPEKESGGRSARILPVRADGRILRGNLAELRDLVYDICKTDNAVIQEVLRSDVRRLYAREFLEELVDRFARIGVAVLLDRDPPTPLFSYFRQILVLGAEGYEVSHHITVISTRGIANVGQGGLLFEYKDEIIEPRYRRDLREAITEAAFGSMESQRRYIKENWREILEDYLSVGADYQGRIPMTVGEDLTGFSDADIPYEMGDYMPVFLVDERDRLTHVFDYDSEELVPVFDDEGRRTEVEVRDEDGKPVEAVEVDGRPAIPMFDGEGKRLPRFDAKGRPIRTLVAYKIEPNPGAGLWRPHDDQLPPERKGEGVYTIFRCLGQRAGAYRTKLRELSGKGASRRKQRQPTATYIPATEVRADARADDAVAKAKAELGNGA